VRVPDHIRRCVAFLAVPAPGGANPSLVGTAFYVSVPAEGLQDARFSYLVTARHVARVLENSSSFAVRVNTRDGKSAFMNIDQHWWYHPTDNSVDVAVTPWSPPDVVECETIPIKMFVTDELIASQSLGTGDEVFIVGLFAHLAGSARNMPIVRVGNIAMMDGEPVHSRDFGFMNAYLIEARSIGGISGSPVFVWSSGVGGLLNTFWLLGSIHGHWDIRPEDKNAYLDEAIDKAAMTNMGIAIVVPAKKILEVFDHPELVQMRRATEERERAKR
jgi:hypothetical protein